MSIPPCTCTQCFAVMDRAAFRAAKTPKGVWVQVLVCTVCQSWLPPGDAPKPGRTASARLEAFALV